MDLIKASQARSMAETRWGRGGTHGTRVSRPGFFYYSCSSHGGFVIDGRALTEEETAQFAQFLPCEVADAIVNTNGKIISFRGPENWRKNLRYYPSRGDQLIHIPIYFAEEDADWCIPVLFAGVAGDKQEAQRCFDKWKAKK